MKPLTQRYLLLFIALAITAFIAGGALVGWKITQDYRLKLGSNDFLVKQLARVKEKNKDTAVANARKKIVRTEKARREKLGATRFFSGRLVEIQRTILAAEINGPVVSIPVEVGNQVKKDETLIAEVDTIWSRLAFEQAQRKIAVSKVQLGFQQREYERLSSLNEQGAGYVSASDLDSQKLKIEELQAEIALQQVVLTEAEKKVARARVFAPFDGAIVNKIAEVGSYVSPGSPLVEIVSTGLIDAELTVSEAFIDRLKIGQTVPIWIDSLNLEASGQIHSIVPLGSTAARAFPVRIRLDDQNGKLKVGMSVRGKLQITDAKESIVVSKDAVLDRPDGALIWIAVPQETAKEEIASQKSLSISSKNGNPASSNENSESKNEDLWTAQPVQVVITARTDKDYAVIPIAQQGRDLLKPGVECVIEGADRLIVGESLRITAIESAFLKDLPKASGHTVIRPIEETAFFNPKTNQVEEKNDNQK
ncbi:MAG: efflux RND transporter periplasmic adaptor subunit [Planctomycetia bacterium]|nr:efflux RND transporter periplasmic adaptor subunit [Planctomycetia bacterium]